MEAKDLKKIVDEHKKWLCGAGRKHAVLNFEDLRGVDLKFCDLRKSSIIAADLQYADLSWADLRETSLINADLSNANLRNADLRGADLSGAVLNGAILYGANLQNALLPTGFYQIAGNNRFKPCITYDSINDRVICVALDAAFTKLDIANFITLENFKQYIEDVYGEGGYREDAHLYKKYKAAATYFDAVKGLGGKNGHTL